MEEVRSSVLKTYQFCAIHYEKWDDTIESCSTSLGTLLRLTDQLECCINAPECVLTQSFPNVRHKIEQSIRHMINEELMFVQTKMEELSSMNHRLKNMWDNSIKLFFKNLPAIKTDESLHVGSELHPPMYCMIEWMDDINLIYSNKFIGVKFQLDIFDGTSESATSLRDKFFSTKSPKVVESILIKMSHFIDDPTVK